MRLCPEAPALSSSEKRRKKEIRKKKKASSSLTRRLLHPRADGALPPAGLCRQDQAPLGPGSPPVTPPSAARRWGPGAREDPVQPRLRRDQRCGKGGKLQLQNKLVQECQLFPSE